jgi:aspartyl-tRNA(Asn)/glutamyl-tRNA(Gln) amidotransferase subunit A
VTTTDLNRLTLSEAAELIGKRQLSPVELVEACLRRIGSQDARLKAFITVSREEALASAQQAASAISGGNYKGPLHGIPFALKDLFDTAGVRTTAGSRIQAERVPSLDATVTARLKAAGAIFVGKLNMHEFAFGATGVNPHYGAVRNPWDTSRISGGSSSGSAAAVAAGMALGALGTDTGGSIRIPSSLCGITGLKPTFGRVSRRGVVPLSWALDHVGPMARTAADAAAILQVIAGQDPLDPSSSDEPVPQYGRDLEDPRNLRRVRIGVPANFFFDNLDAEVMDALREVVPVFEGLEAELVEVALPLVQEAGPAVSAIMLPEALAYHHRWLAERADDYGDDVRGRLEMGAAFPAVAYVEAQRFRAMMVEQWRENVFDRVDLLLTPATAVPAPSLDEGDLQATMSLIRFTNPFNLLGTPAVSLPCGFTSAGLPIGLQIVGRWWEEGTVLRAANAYQHATDWHTRTPPL